MKKFILDMHSKSITSAREDLDRKLTAIFKTVFLDIGQEWQAKYPKRKLELIAGMGTMFWAVDDEIIHTDNEAGYSKSTWTPQYKNKLNFSWKHWRVNSDNNEALAYKIFEPLLIALEWANDNLIDGEYLDRYSTDIKDFK